MSKLQPGHRFRRTCRIKESIRRHQDRLSLPRASRWGGLRIKECTYVRRTAKDLDEPNRLRARQRRCCRGSGGHLEVPLHGGHERRQRLSLPLHPHDLHRGRRPADRRSGARPCGPRRHRDGLPQPRGPRPQAISAFSRASSSCASIRPSEGGRSPTSPKRPRARASSPTRPSSASTSAASSPIPSRHSASSGSSCCSTASSWRSTSRRASSASPSS